MLPPPKYFTVKRKADETQQTNNNSFIINLVNCLWNLTPVDLGFHI